ncbi:MAG: AMP-binding protein [Planctomycetes bacterium]|nr:AMP-binding protein [Planctomycetota bacterium]
MRMRRVKNMDAATARKALAARHVRRSPPTKHRVKWKNIHDLLAARADAAPDKPFLIYFGEDGGRAEHTYAAFRERVMRTARYMAETLGVGRGDRVGTITHNAPETVFITFACWTLGAVVAPMNVGEDDERIVFSLNNAGVCALFVRQEYAARAAGLLARLKGVRAVVGVESPEWWRGAGDGLPASWRRFAETEKVSGDWRPKRAADLEDEALIVYTSGTTGAPKGVLLTQYNLLVDADAIARHHGFGPADRGMCVLPIHHVNGAVVTLVTPLFFGGSVVLNRKFSPRGFWRRVEEEGVTFCSVVPTLLEFLYETGETPTRSRKSRFRRFICGAGPLTVDLAARFEERFGVPIIHGYGLSETTCYSCFLPVDLRPAEHQRWMRAHGHPSIGVPVACNEMAIHDEQGKAQGPGVKGEIVIRGHNVMRAYHARPDANRDTFAHGWFRSGDEGFFLRDGAGRPFFFITGRLKELIVRGGVKISTLELDELLMALPGVQCGLAVGFENKWYGEEVGAYVVPDGSVPLTEPEIVDACRRKWPAAKCPKVVVFGTEAPVTSTGKYQRLKLAPLFARWKETQFRA